MGIYSERLPQLNGDTCITDAGLETELVFLQGMELPEFAAYHLLKTDRGTEVLLEYWQQFHDLAAKHGVGVVFETATWRANADWGKIIGDCAEQLEQLNRKSVEVLDQMRARHANTPLVISGCVGPRGDGYSPGVRMTADEARRYHTPQIATFANCNADLIGALTLNYIEEAIGITQAAQDHGLPVAISFTLETDGKLPTGESLQSAIAAVDDATANGPAYYMINCAHPTHFDHLFAADHPWTQRLLGIRANASRLSHAELDAAEELDDGDPCEFGHQYRQLLDRLPHLTVLGGCCGTDFRHIEQVCRHVM